MSCQSGFQWSCLFNWVYFETYLESTIQDLQFCAVSFRPDGNIVFFQALGQTKRVKYAERKCCKVDWQKRLQAGILIASQEKIIAALCPLLGLLEGRREVMESVAIRCCAWKWGEKRREKRCKGALKSVPAALIQGGATTSSFLTASPAVPARPSPTHQLGAQLSLPYPLHLLLLPWEEGWALLRMCHWKLLITFSPFFKTESGVLGMKTVLGGAGSGVPGQLQYQREIWHCHLGCGKLKPLGRFIDRVRHGEPNYVPPPVAMGMGNALLQRQQHTADGERKICDSFSFPDTAHAPLKGN